MLQTAAQPDLPRDPRATSAHVVFTFYTEGWAGASKRGWYASDARLARHLVDGERVERLVAASNQRSLPLLAMRRLMGERTSDFPAGPTRHLVEPTRWRRTDPRRVVPLRRSIRAYEASLRRAAEQQGLHRPALITSNPFLAGFGELAWTRSVTYYGIDDWAVHPHFAPWWPAVEVAYAGMREHGRRVVTVAQSGLDRIGPTGPGLVLPNGLEPSEWLTPAPPPARREASDPRVLVYVGTLDERLDVGMIERVASELPDTLVRLVGPVVDEGRLKPLRTLANVELRPRVGRDEVTTLIRSADAGLVPHVRNPLTAAMSPLKLYEYLAGGLPVAAIDLPPMREVDPRVVLAAEPEDFVRATRTALALGRAPEAEREAFVRGNSWASRFDQLLDLAFAA